MQQQYIAAFMFLEFCSNFNLYTCKVVPATDVVTDVVTVLQLWEMFWCNFFSHWLSVTF